MKKRLFSGSGVAIVTPMNADGSVNFEKLTELLEFQVQNGTDAIIVCGTTGESAALSDVEHREVIRHTIACINGRVPVIAGTGSNDTRYCIELSKEAEKLGADGLLLVTPYYNKASQKGLIKHYFAVADAVNIPMIIYSVPSRTGVNIAPKTCLALSKHKNIVAIKEASGNISQIAQIRQLCGDELDLYSGNDDQAFVVMALGGRGVISVSANILPKETHDMCQAFLDGDIEKSRALQLQYLSFCNALFSDVNPIPIKEAMNQKGMNVGPCRLPLCEMDDDKIEALKEEMKAIGLL